MYKTKIVDLSNGDEVFVDYTDEENAQLQAAKLIAEKEIEDAAKIAIAKASLFAKLGITEEEAKLLLS